MLCPFADIRLLHPENEAETPIVPTQFIVHSAVTSADSLFGWFDREDVFEESHFWVAADGSIEQYIDTERQADAQWDGNLHGVSVETWDDRDPNHVPWTLAQIDSLVRIGHWLRDVHAIPMRVCPGPQSSGVGYHRLFTEWNRNLHTCPGDIRVTQFYDELLPRLMEESDMPLTADDLAAIASQVRAELNRGTGLGQADWASTCKAQLSTVQTSINEHNTTQAAVAAVQAAVDGLTIGGGSIDTAALAAALANELAARLQT